MSDHLPETICPTCGDDYRPLAFCPNDHRGMDDHGFVTPVASAAPTSHLPECDCSDPSVPRWRCDCDRLRACEQRVAKGRRQDVADARNLGYGEGYAEGVQAARDAVAAADPYWKVESDDGAVFVVEVAAALAAIDALRGGS